VASPRPLVQNASMARRRRLRRRRREGSTSARVAAVLARVILLVLVAVAAGYAFYLALSWVASEGARRSLGG
jgi:hypothetical protein